MQTRSFPSKASAEEEGEGEEDEEDLRTHKKSFFPVLHSRASSPFLRAYKKYTRGDPATKRLQHTNDDDAKHVLTNMEEGIQQGSMRREFEGGGGGGNKKKRL